jgi:dienelactone hydrolase
MRILLALFLTAGMAMSVQAEIKTELIDYRDGDVVLQGYLAYDDAQTGSRPGILIVHQWMGLTDYEKMRARQLAELGYVAFAADIYGKNVRPQNMEEAAEQAGKYRSNRQLLRERAAAGLNWLRQHELTDSTRVAAIGYCFGGGTVLELARSGAHVNGVVSFHGNLDTPDPEDARQIIGKVLVCHGAEDPHVTIENVDAFQREMDDAGVDWYMISYGGAVHGFTQPGAGDDPSRGVAYNAAADRRSWRAMRNFFDEIFK